MIPVFRKSVAFLVILVTILFNGSGAGFRIGFVESLEERSSAVAVIAAGDEDGRTGSGDLRRGITSFDEVAAAFGDSVIMSPYFPHVLHLAASDTSRFPTDVYHEIFVPPQNVA